MLKTIFSEDQIVAPLQRHADHRSAAWSVLTGFAINKSIESGQVEKIDSMIHSLTVPPDLCPR